MKELFSWAAFAVLCGNVFGVMLLMSVIWRGTKRDFHESVKAYNDSQRDVNAKVTTLFLWLALAVPWFCLTAMLVLAAILVLTR